MIATKYKLSTGVGVGTKYLPSFDKALVVAGVGNYNLVRLSSILPAGCVEADKIDLPEGSLLPTAYSTITSDVSGGTIVSTIGVGIPVNKDDVGVIMEYSCLGSNEKSALETLHNMIREAFDVRGWKLDHIQSTSVSHVVEDGEVATTFACIAEWW